MVIKNVRSYLVVVFSFCLALFSFSSLAHIDDPYLRIQTATGPKFIPNKVRTAPPLTITEFLKEVHPYNNPPALSVKTPVTLEGTSRVVRSQAVVNVPRSVAANALKRCLSRGPVCLGPQFFLTGGITLGLGIYEFLNSQGFQVDEKGTVFNLAEVGTFPVPGQLLAAIDANNLNQRVGSYYTFDGTSWSLNLRDFSNINSRRYDLSNSQNLSAEDWLFNYSYLKPDDPQNYILGQGVNPLPGFTNNNYDWQIEYLGSGNSYAYYRKDLFFYKPVGQYYSTMVLTLLTQAFPIDNLPAVESLFTLEAPLVNFDDVDFSLYTPDSTDLGILAEDLYLPDFNPEFDDIEINLDPFPAYEYEFQNESLYENDILTGTKETTKWQEFPLSDNPSRSPGVSNNQKTEVVIKDPSGQVIGGSETNTTQPPPPPGVPPVPPSTGTGEGGFFSCANFRFICDWFDWTQDDSLPSDDLLDTPDIELDFDDVIVEKVLDWHEYNLEPLGVASCPEPIQIDLEIYGIHEISFDLFCDFLANMKAVFLAVCMIIASLIVYRGLLNV